MHLPRFHQPTKAIFNMWCSVLFENRTWFVVHVIVLPLCLLHQEMRCSTTIWYELYYIIFLKNYHMILFTSKTDKKCGNLSSLATVSRSSYLHPSLPSLPPAPNPLDPHIRPLVHAWVHSNDPRHSYSKKKSSRFIDSAILHAFGRFWS